MVVIDSDSDDERKSRQSTKEDLSQSLELIVIVRVMMRGSLGKELTRNTESMHTLIQETMRRGEKRNPNGNQRDGL